MTCYEARAVYKDDAHASMMIDTDKGLKAATEIALTRFATTLPGRRLVSVHVERMPEDREESI